MMVSKMNIKNSRLEGVQKRYLKKSKNIIRGESMPYARGRKIRRAKVTGSCCSRVIYK